MLKELNIMISRGTPHTPSAIWFKLDISYRQLGNTRGARNICSVGISQLEHEQK